VIFFAKGPGMATILNRFAILLLIYAVLNSALSCSKDEVSKRTGGDDTANEEAVSNDAQAEQP
jgi:hypothetical protein